MYNLETVLQHSIPTQVHHMHTIGQMFLLEHTTLRLSQLTIVERQQLLHQLLLPFKVVVVVEDEAVEATTTVLLELIEIH